MFKCNSKRRSGAIALVLALVLVCVSSNPVDDPNEAGVQIEAPDRIVNKLFGWMPSFEQFKAKYHKDYKSVFEEMRRKSILMANELQAWVSQVNFKQKRCASFMVTTDKSDMTDEELDSNLLNREDHNKKSLEVLISETEPPKDNVEAASWLSKIKDLATGTLGKVAGSADYAFDKFDAAVDSAFASVARHLKYRPDLPDEVFIDHRKGDACLNRVRDQGRCGSCYILSTVALYEWAYCKQTKTPIKFSEQYMLDCGHLAGMEGCGGGHESEVATFIKQYGLELLDDYKYDSKPKSCPWQAKKIKSAEMGRVRMVKSGLSFVWPNKIDEELKKGPLVTAIIASSIFHRYGGGLDDGKGCESTRKGPHSVLIVGSGRQEGYEYWILRNSYGPWWGESGYYKLRKDSKCMREFTTYRLKALASDDKNSKYHFYGNPDYKPRSASDNSN